MVRSIAFDTLLANRLDISPRVRLDGSELDPLLALAVLDAGLGEVVQDRLFKVGRLSVRRADGLADRFAAPRMKIARKCE